MAENNLKFDDAFAQIEQIVLQIEQEQIPLDELAEKVKAAKKLIAFCEAKLKDIEATISDTGG